MALPVAMSSAATSVAVPVPLVVAGCLLRESGAAQRPDWRGPVQHVVWDFLSTLPAGVGDDCERAEWLGDDHGGRLLVLSTFFEAYVGLVAQG